MPRTRKHELRRMRVTVLTNLEREDATTHDIVVDQVTAALRANGHKVKLLSVYSDIDKLIDTLREQKPHLVFNLIEQWGKNVRGDVAVAGALELLTLRHTGGGPGELYLRQDKALTKELLAY